MLTAGAAVSSSRVRDRGTDGEAVDLLPPPPVNPRPGMSPGPTTPAGRIARRGWVVAVSTLGLLAALYALALVLTSQPRFEAALRERILAAISARLGPTTLGPEVH